MIDHDLITATRLEWRLRPDGKELLLRVESRTHPLTDIRFPISEADKIFAQLANILGKSIPENRPEGKLN